MGLFLANQLFRDRFSTLAALGGFPPPHSTISLRHFVYHNGCLLAPKLDDRNHHPVPATLSSFTKILKLFLMHALTLAVLFSCLAPMEYCPIQRNRSATEIYVSFEFGHLVNNLVAAGKKLFCPWLQSLNLPTHPPTLTHTHAESLPKCHSHDQSHVDDGFYRNGLVGSTLDWFPECFNGGQPHLSFQITIGFLG